MRFLFRPFLQNLSSDSSLVFAEGTGLCVEPYIDGLRDSEPEILERETHVLARSREDFYQTLGAVIQMSIGLRVEGQLTMSKLGEFVSRHRRHEPVLTPHPPLRNSGLANVECFGYGPIGPEDLQRIGFSHATDSKHA